MACQATPPVRGCQGPATPSACERCRMLIPAGRCHAVPRNPRCQGPGSARACTACRSALGRVQRQAATVGTLKASPTFDRFLTRIWAERARLLQSASVSDGIYGLYSQTRERHAGAMEARRFEDFARGLQSIAGANGLRPIPQWTDLSWSQIWTMTGNGDFGRDARSLASAGCAFYFFGTQPSAAWDRVYVHATLPGRLRVMRFLVPVLKMLHHERRISIVWAKVTGPLLDRLDTIVIYLGSKDEQQTVVRELQAAMVAGQLARADFAPGVPAMTKPVAPGISTGSEPAADRLDLGLQFSSPGLGRQSFGTLRADLLAQALEGARMEEEFRLKVETLFWQNGIRMDDPSVQTDFAAVLQEHLVAARAPR